MVIGPGTYDSRRTAIARKHNYDSPSDNTKKEVEEAKAADKVIIIRLETFLG